MKAKRKWSGIKAKDVYRILFMDEFKSLRKADVVALANFLDEVERTLKEKNS